VLYLRLIILSVGGDVLVDSEMFLVIDFMNFKIKSVQSFRCAHMGRVCVRVFIEISAHTCYTVFLKKKLSLHALSLVLCLPLPQFISFHLDFLNSNQVWDVNLLVVGT
jgi:hypothetical protein